LVEVIGEESGEAQSLAAATRVSPLGRTQEILSQTAHDTQKNFN